MHGTAYPRISFPIFSDERSDTDFSIFITSVKGKKIMRKSKPDLRISATRLSYYSTKPEKIQLLFSRHF